MRRPALVAFSIGAALLPLASAQAAVSTGHSGWAWGNPAPQGNEIRSLEFIGNRGYALGEFGTLLRTDDAGASWTGIVTGLTEDLARVRIIDSDSLVIAGGCALRRSDDAGQTFTRLPWTASDLNCPDSIMSIAFPTAQVGYVVIANGAVFRTADGGRSWAQKTVVPGTQGSGGSEVPADVLFTSAGTGVVVATGGRIYRTTDGAGSWTLVGSHSQSLNGLFFVDPTTGYAVGSAGSVLKTTDGGASWSVKASGGTTSLESIRCASASTCLVTTGGPGKEVLRTIDGADSFISVTPSTDRMLAAAFASPTRAVAAGALGTTVVSNDAGATWSSVGGRLSGKFTNLSTTSPSLAFAAGFDGALARTTDGGNTWAAIGVPTAGDIHAVSFPSPTIGYVLAGNSVLKTGNGGSSWQILNTDPRAGIYALVALDASGVLLIGDGVLRSTDGGNEFSPVRGKVRKATLFDADRLRNFVFAWGTDDLFVSRNGGKRWTKVKPPRGLDVILLDVEFVTPRRAFALTKDGRVWETRNRGKRWRRLFLTDSDDGLEFAENRAISFSSPSNGWIASNRFGDENEGYVLRTSDGGKTWRPQLVDGGIALDPLREVIATGDRTGLVVSDSSGLLTTASGGDAGRPTALELKAKKRRLRKPTRIKLTGRLRPAEGSERVVVLAQTPAGSEAKVVTVASNGTFTTSWKVRRTSYFVAQWAGDDDRAGDGSKVLTVKVRKRRR